MTTPGRITPDDIEAKFREIQGEVEEVEHQALDYAVIAVAAVAVTVVVVAFLLGSRRGRKRRAVIEIRRI
jgi:ABC-type tungstate transport system substrate-binding protein